MILTFLFLLNKSLMELQSETILTGYSEQEKAAYLGALAALATADREADNEELDHLREIAHAAGISPENEQTILRAAQDTSGADLKRCLDVLKTSELRFSLITDLIAVAKADDSYTEEEKRNVEKVSKYLDVNTNQFSVLDQFVSKAASSDNSSQSLASPNVIQSLGMQDKFANAGLNIGSMGKSILGFLGPILLGGMAAKALKGRTGSGTMGGLGGMLGGMLGGNTMGMGGGSFPGGLGGLGSLVSGLNKSRNNQSMGGLLGRLLRN
jgi:uncharacterized tellurite resistance protein B-like protein